MEEQLLIDIGDILKGLRVVKDNENSRPLFKKVIANAAPIWTAVETVPAICYYLESTEYDTEDCALRYTGTSKVMLYIYNKHRAKGLSLDDILSPLIARTREALQALDKTNGSVLNATISSVKRDAGTVLPYTIAELTLEIDFAEQRTC